MTTIKPRCAEVVIYQGDDLQRISELRRIAESAQRIADEASRQPLRMGDDNGSTAANERKAEYDAFVDEAAERAVIVEVRALGRKRFRSLMAEHPARKVANDEGEQVVHDDDAPFDVNSETFAEPFLAVSIVEPVFPTPADRDDFLDSLSEGDFDKLFATAYFLNRVPSADPKESRYSATPRSSDAT